MSWNRLHGLRKGGEMRFFMWAASVSLVFLTTCTAQQTSSGSSADGAGYASAAQSGSVGRWTSGPPRISQKRVHTAGYLLGYAGAKIAPGPQLNQVAQWYDLIETDANHANSFKQANAQGKTMAYIDPHRLIQGEATLAYMSENAYTHCNGEKLIGRYSSKPMWAMDVRTPEALEAITREMRQARGSGIDYVFVDDTGPPNGYQCMPDNYDDVTWARADAKYLDAAAANNGTSIIYNGAGTPYSASLQYSDYLSGKAHILGGMMENCFNDLQSSNPPGPYVYDGGSYPLWTNTARALLRLQNYSPKQLAICYGNDTEPAFTANNNYASDIRTYTLASFLMFYDPQTSYLWEFFKNQSGVTVQPEAGLVALNPLIRTPKTSTEAAVEMFNCGGVRCREYNDCYLRGMRVGYCAVEVNFKDGPTLPGARWRSGRKYGRILKFTGSGIVSVPGSVPTDDGKVQIVTGSPPESLCSPGSAQRASITGCQTSAVVFGSDFGMHASRTAKHHKPHKKKRHQMTNHKKVR